MDEKHGIKEISDGFLQGRKNLSPRLEWLIMAGVADGIFRVASDATDRPNDRFYDTIKAAVKEWMDANPWVQSTSIVKKREVEALALWEEFFKDIKDQDIFVRHKRCFFCEVLPGELHADNCIYIRAERLVDSE